MSEQTMSQQRALAALKAVNGLKRRDQEFRTAYRSYIKGLPATIQMTGLGQTVAMCMARNKDGEGNKAAYGTILEHLQGWLCGSCDWSPYKNDPGGRLIDAIVKGNQAAYMQATHEAIAYLDWLKKFANALLAAEPAQPGAPEP